MTSVEGLRGFQISMSYLHTLKCVFFKVRVPVRVDSVRKDVCILRHACNFVIAWLFFIA